MDVQLSVWKRDIPMNICLIYLSYLPLRFSIPPDKSNYVTDPFGLDDSYDPPIGNHLSMTTLSSHCWFTMENWLKYRYYTLLLYPFSYTKMSYLPLFFNLHIVPATGIASYWFAYFCGSIGGGVGKVIAYYYGLYKVHQNRKVRREKYNFEDIATKQYELAMSHQELNPDEKIEKQSYNPHDYIDDKLLNKLYYASNAREPYFGPEMPMYGLSGFALCQSAHYLYRQLKRYTEYRINDLGDDHIGDDEKYDINDSMHSMIANIDWKKWRQNALTGYHGVTFTYFGIKLFLVSKSFYLQRKEKEKDRGGYGHMSCGRGSYGVDLGSVMAFAFGMAAYPIVLMVQKVWKRNDRSDWMMSSKLPIGNIDKDDEKGDGKMGAPTPLLQRQQGNNGSNVSIGGSVSTLPKLNRSGNGSDSNLFRLNTSTPWDETEIEEMAQEMEIEIQSVKSRTGTATPSNLVHDDSTLQWKFDSLEDQEHEIKRQMSMLKTVTAH